MNTAFITLDVSVPANSADLPGVVETALRQYGEPLRWAITEIVSTTDSERGSTRFATPLSQAKARIEAIVTTGCSPSNCQAPGST
ncbi:hypothetical protein [Alkalinema sp. FACHB-956]|uniref:hypothetical protein n=1 Tax=Alkalinema sp. FACHB-956 TaxID=2692768 RepID=UPI0016867279|nr:hypothetical protein [Alkalinema sp. FACHB-956]MBD2327521.1 hypothetical protein [Alkalinema sp. FACHB-956]